MSRQDIENGEQQWQKAFNAGDASAVAALYAEDAKLLPPNMDILEGRAAIEGFVKEFIGAMKPEGMNLQMIDFLEGGDIGVSVGRYEMKATVEGNEITDSGKFIEVWKRQPDGSFQIAADQFSSNLPAEGPG